MSEVIDFLMKAKRTDGTYDILHPITKTANVKTAEAIPVMLNNNVGSFVHGDVIAAGTSIDAIVRKLVQAQIPPVYTAPTISISVTSGTSGGYYEEGTTAEPTISAAFTKNDAGSLANLIIKKNNVNVKGATSSPVSYTENFVITGTTIFNASATYGAGLIKKDNFDQDYITGSINAGTITSVDIIYTSYRKFFWGSDTVTTPASSSNTIRSLTNSSTQSASNGVSFTINATKGQRRITIAYPANIRDITSIEYIEMGNDDSKELFTKTIVPVEGANGFTAIDYKVYTFIADQPFPSDMTFKVTI